MSRSPRPRPVRLLLGAIAVVLALALAVPPAATAPRRPASEPVIFDGEHGLPDVDGRRGSAAPSPEQVAAADALGATRVSWSRFGTPQSLIRHGGYLATGLSRDPVRAASSFLSQNGTLFRLSGAELSSLAPANVASLGERAHAVLFRQTFGGLPAGHDGLVTVGIDSGKVFYVSSSLTGDTAVTGSVRLSPVDAWRRAAADVGRDANALSVAAPKRQQGWTVFRVDGLLQPQRARLVAVPTPVDGVRPAFHTLFVDVRDGRAEAYAHFVDAETGAVLLRQSLVDHQQAEPPPPAWKVFPAYPIPPEFDFGGSRWIVPSTDIREIWCWGATGQPLPPGCDDQVANPASRVPWDVFPPVNQPSFTTMGNNAHSAEAWTTAFTPGPTGYRPVTPSRLYIYPWTNQWAEEACNPATFASSQRVDIDAATANLFVMHNRMHDWSYHLGFTEQSWNGQQHNYGTRPQGERDPILGDVQAGGLTGGFPGYLGRDNANMITLPDGIPSITNMYLWQPIRGAAYLACVDGDYDMAVIAHEYGHMIENRMIGKGSNRAGHHAGAMGESHADLMAMEILNEYGFVPVADENRYAVGAYVTTDKETGVRNFAMNWPSAGLPQPGQNVDVNPLNFSDMGYDITGPQVHADGEIWTATNFDIRELLVEKYNRSFPESNLRLQRECAEGRRPADRCPGNRRWIQLVFDAFLLMPTAPTMLDARDAMLAADMARFGGRNRRELWLAFARRGMGQAAFSTNSTGDSILETGQPGGNDEDPKPDFTSPLHEEATVTFQAVDPGTRAPITNARIFVGHYEARVSPIADTNPATNAGAAARPGFPATNNLDAVASFVPGTYDFVANAPRYGHTRFQLTLPPGQSGTFRIPFATNWASAANGAVATGDGTRHQQLIDDTEGTNWESTGSPIAGKQVVVDLAGDRAVPITRIQASAMLVPPNILLGSSQNRFTAVRSFSIEVCTKSGTNPCTAAENFTPVRTFVDAFPGESWRPRAPHIILREFQLGTSVRATHVRFVVIDNQCTGNPLYHGEQDDDPLNHTDCRTPSSGSPNPPPGSLPARDTEVRAAELQVFSR
ncbi:MAG TPA: M36 family metallopeptidase [Actinomycetota bacterium]|nr:M36 family metallopeptidase [Actinomycetota bacterium]